MGYLANTLTAIVSTVLGRQIYDSGPHLSSWLIRQAARRLPTDAEQQRREEEWLAHLHDQPGIAGFYHAAGSLLASYRMLLPFETVAIRCAIWLIYYGTEIMLDQWVLKPYCKKANAAAGSANKEHIEASLDYICIITAQKIIFRLGRKNLQNIRVDRSKLWDTISSFKNT